MGVILSIGPIKGTEVDFWNAGNADYLVIVCKTLRQKKSQQNSQICTCRGLLSPPLTCQRGGEETWCCPPPPPPPPPLSPQRVWSVRPPPIVAPERVLVCLARVDDPCVFRAVHLQPILFTLFVCLFVCWNKPRKIVLRLLLGGK